MININHDVSQGDEGATFRQGEDLAAMAGEVQHGNPIDLEVFKELDGDNRHISVLGKRVRAYNINVTGFPQELSVGSQPPREYPVYFELPGLERNYEFEGWKDRVEIITHIIPGGEGEERVKNNVDEDWFVFHDQEELELYLQEAVLPDLEARIEDAASETQHMAQKQLSDSSYALPPEEREAARKAAMRRRAAQEGR